MFFSEHQCEISSGFWSHCSSKLHWLWEEIQYGWAYMVCSYPWSRMGYFHTIRCEINEESLSRLRSHLCCTDNNFRGVYFALVFFLYKSISHAIVKLRCYLKYNFLWKKKKIVIAICAYIHWLNVTSPSSCLSMCLYCCRNCQMFLCSWVCTASVPPSSALPHLQLFSVLLLSMQDIVYLELM